MKRYPIRLKIALLSFCAIIGSISSWITYNIKIQELTPWQLAQEIDFDKQTGSTKFQVLIDSFTVGGFTFGISAIVIILLYKFIKANKK